MPASCSARRSPKLAGVAVPDGPDASNTDVSGTSSSSVIAMRRETLGCITPRSICETALGEIPSRLARSRADIPRATRSARSRSPTPGAASSGGSTAEARLMIQIVSVAPEAATAVEGIDTCSSHVKG